VLVRFSVLRPVVSGDDITVPQEIGDVCRPTGHQTG
jgi:hypothetical protein